MNSHQTAVPLSKAYLLLNHGPVTLVSSAAGGQRNVMAAAWAMPLDFSPPKVAVVIDRNTLTRQLMEDSGEFVLNIPSRTQAEQILKVGSSTGREIDKFAELGLTGESGTRVSAPLIDGCVAWLECKILPEPANQEKYDLFLAEVVAAWADPAVFSEGRWHFPSPGQHTLHYAAGGHFFATGEGFDVS